MKETTSLDRGGHLVKKLNVTYMVGSLGPFTLVTTQADLQSGAALQEMQKFAVTLGTLPGVPA